MDSVGKVDLEWVKSKSMLRNVSSGKRTIIWRFLCIHCVDLPVIYLKARCCIASGNQWNGRLSYHPFRVEFITPATEHYREESIP
jgi:hypothetical protein